MELDIRKLVALGVLAGALGFGGAAVAGAQEATTDDGPTTTVAPSEDETTGDAPDREGCDEDAPAPDAEGSAAALAL